MIMVIGTTVISFVIIFFVLLIFAKLRQKVFDHKCSIAISAYTFFILLIASFFIFPFIDSEQDNLEKLVKKENVTQESSVKNENAVNEKTTQNDIITILATKIVEKTAQLSTATLIAVFLGFCFYACFCAKSNAEKNETFTEKPKTFIEKRDTFLIYSALLMRLLIMSFASSSAPTGISLILCALFEDIKIEQMSGVEVYLAYAGLSLIFMTVLVIIEEIPHIDRLLDLSSKKSNLKS